MGGNNKLYYLLHLSRMFANLKALLALVLFFLYSNVNIHIYLLIQKATRDVPLPPFFILFIISFKGVIFQNANRNSQMV